MTASTLASVYMLSRSWRDVSASSFMNCTNRGSVRRTRITAVASKRKQIQHVQPEDVGKTEEGHNKVVITSEEVEVHGKGRIGVGKTTEETRTVREGKL